VEYNFLHYDGMFIILFFLSLIIVRILCILCITFYESLWINFKKMLINDSFMLISQKISFFSNYNTIFKLFDDNVETRDIAITVRPSSSVSFPHLNSFLTKHSTKLNQILGWSSTFWGLFFFQFWKFNIVAIGLIMLSDILKIQIYNYQNECS